MKASKILISAWANYLKNPSRVNLKRLDDQMRLEVPRLAVYSPNTLHAKAHGNLIHNLVGSPQESVQWAMAVWLLRNPPQPVKYIIPILGNSGVGKTSTIKKMLTKPGVSAYHIASPFKKAMQALYGMDPDNKETRDQPVGPGEPTLGYLMGTAFQEWKQWHPNVLLPGLIQAVQAWLDDPHSSILMVDGVRSAQEVEWLADLGEINPYRLVSSRVEVEPIPEILEAQPEAFKAARAYRMITFNLDDEPTDYLWGELQRYLDKDRLDIPGVVPSNTVAGEVWLSPGKPSIL